MRAIVFWERVFFVMNVLASIALVAGALATVALIAAIGAVLRKTKARYYALVTEDGPEIHAPLPDLEGYTPEGELMRTRDFAGEELAVLLLRRDCPPCEAVLAAVEPLRRALTEPPSFLVVAECTVAEAAGYMRRYRLRSPVIADPEGAIRRRLGVERTPYGFLLDAQGIVRMKGVLNHRHHLAALVSRRGRGAGALGWEALGAPLGEAASREAASARPGV